MDTDKIYAEKLAEEYAPKDTSKVVALKKLDRRVKLPATVFTCSFGITFTLLLGVGMCIVLGRLASPLAVGITLCVIGIIGMAVNYPIYQRILKLRKEIYAPTVIELAKQVSDEQATEEE